MRLNNSEVGDSKISDSGMAIWLLRQEGATRFRALSRAHNLLEAMILYRVGLHLLIEDIMIICMRKEYIHDL